MEQHTDEKGGLRGKFEDFSYTPKEEVWDRIAAGPGERPLGALFATFAWIPNARVWKRISAEMHPMPVLRIASWSAAAAAAVALFVWLQFGGTDAGEHAGNGLAMSDQATGKHLANSDTQGCWSDRQFLTEHKGEHNSLADADRNNASDHSKAKDLAGSFPLAEKDGHPSNSPHHQPVPKNDRSIAAAGSGLRIVHDWPAENRPNWPSELMPRTFATLDLPIALQDINRRTTQIAAVNLERERMAQADVEAGLQAQGDDDAQGLRAPIVAQAGASLSGDGMVPGSRNAFTSLDDFYSLGTNAVAQEASSDRVSYETFRSPVVVGAAVDHRVWKGLGVGANLVYTHMRSSQDGYLGDVAQHLDVTRQYLGLGTNLSYTQSLSKRKDRVALYGTTGLQYDWGLAKHTTLTTYRQGTVLAKESEDPKLGGQASVNGGLGLRYTIFKNIGLYAQAGAAHYFYFTEANLYTSRVLWPSMQVGLRVQL